MALKVRHTCSNSSSPSYRISSFRFPSRIRSGDQLLYRLHDEPVHLPREEGRQEQDDRDRGCACKDKHSEEREEDLPQGRQERIFLWEISIRKLSSSISPIYVCSTA